MRALLLSILFAAWLVSCDAGDGDIAGGAPGPAHHAEIRIAALSPAIATTLQELGLESSIVARHGYDVTLDPAIPSAGDQSGLDYETLIGVDPTHVLLDWGSRGTPDRLRALADDRGWTIETIRMTTLSESRDAFSRLAALFGVEDTLTPRLDAALAPRPTRAHVGRVLVLMRDHPPEALGPGAHHHEILIALGASPAITEGAPWQALDTEDLRRIDPDAVVLVTPNAGGEPPFLPLGLAHVGVIDTRDALLPGASMIRFADALAARLDRWAADQPSVD